MAHVSSVNNLAMLREIAQTTRITEATLSSGEVAMEAGETVRGSLTTRKETKIHMPYVSSFSPYVLHKQIEMLIILKIIVLS